MKRDFGVSKWVIAALSMVSASAMAVPITVDQLQLSEEQKVALLRQLNVMRTAASKAPPPLSAPGIVFGSPLAFGQFFGEAAASLGGGTFPPGQGKRTDGSLAVSAGLGTSQSVGLETTLNIVSINAGFGDSGSFSSKLHKLLTTNTAVAVGAESYGSWGLAKQRDASLYGVITTVQRIPGISLPIALNLGTGSGRFRDSLQSVADSRLGVFGGFAIIFNDRVSFIADYTGVGMNTAVSFVPVRSQPITASLGMTNIGRHDGATREFAAAVGYRLSF